ncbi:MAG: hypothetical protein AB1351_01425 [Thermoproteota archaeon]
MASYDAICRKVLSIDPSIRFAGIATLDGDIVIFQYKIGVTPLLTEEETSLSVMQSVMRAGTRRTLEHKLGKTAYATAVYEKVKRATIILYNEDSKADAALIVSFERDADHEAIITEKILPFLDGIVKGLAN